MNGLTDDQIDKIIKAKFKEDATISDKANSVFANFDPSKFGNQNNIEQVQFNNQFVNNPVKHDEENNQREYINNNANNAGKKIIEVNFYQKLNRILSVAAVSLTVVLVGGTALYFNKGGNNNNQTSIIYNQTQLVKNEKLELSNEKIFKSVENNYIKVYMLGKRDIGINLTSRYWDEFGKEYSVTDCYKVDNITEDVSDIFLGEIGGAGLPYVFLLMENGTVQYIDLHCYTNNQFYFTTTKLLGLYDVVGFEQKTRKYSYSNKDYEYVNAIKSDGLRKEIEIGMVNNWNDNTPVNYNKLNEKYIKAYNKEAVIDDGKGDYTVNNVTYLQVDGETKFAYCMKGSKFYRVERSNAKEECIADGVSGYARNNPDGRITVFLMENYEIFSLDKNIKYQDKNKNIINKITEKETIDDKNNTDNGQDNDNTNTNPNGNKKTDPYQNLAETKYKTQGFRTTYGTRIYVYEIEFDKYIRPTITISRIENDKSERLYRTNDVRVKETDVAAGTTYVTFEITAESNYGDEPKIVKGTAQIKYSNVTENDVIGLKVEVDENGKTINIDNNGDYLYLEKQK